jgi:ParB family chromosome partitioning protein
MPRKGANVTLSSYDEIFTTEESRTESQQEHVQMIPLSELHPFEGHPFRVVDDDEMQKTVESVKQYGVLTPAIARPDPDGGYEIISGHRRLRASELAGLDKLPVIVREMDDDTAIIFMVDSNLQREHILPSERAFAYKMKMDALKHQGERKDLQKGSTSRQVVGKLEAADIIGQDTGESGRQVQRFIRLTELIPEIRDMVDEKKIAFNPAVELSYLKPEEQREFLDAMDYAQAAPSLSQAQRLKKLSQEGECKLDAMCEVMNEVKKDDMTTITIPHDVLRKYFPRSYTPQQMQDVIVKLLDQWQKKRNREQAR